MNTNRFSKFSVGLIILAVAFVSVSFATMNNSSKKVSSNTYLPLPPGKQTQLFNAAREARILYHRSSSASSVAAYPDYFQRHLELSNLAALGQGASDYAERHPELSAASVSGAGASDYFERHPELLKPAIQASDTSDYFLRHPELSAQAASSVDLSDYYFRHIND
jgi:hypothetical protein